jgi:hypothetical protein
MKRSEIKLSGSAEEISWFIYALRNVRGNRNSPAGWESLRRGDYLGGKTKSQERRRGSFGEGLAGERFTEEQWSAIFASIAEEERKRELQENFRALREEALGAHLDAFIDKHFSSAPESEKEELRRFIDREVFHERFEDLEIFLGDIHSFGYRVAEKKRKSLDNGFGGFARLSYAFLVAGAIVEITLAVMLLKFVESGFQTLALSLLLLIYVHGRASTEDLQIKSIFNLTEMRSLFMRISHLLKENEELLAMNRERNHESARELEKASVKMLIRSGKAGLLAAIAIVSILTTLL